MVNDSATTDVESFNAVFASTTSDVGSLDSTTSDVEFVNVVFGITTFNLNTFDSLIAGVKSDDTADDALTSLKSIEFFPKSTTTGIEFDSTFDTNSVDSMTGVNIADVSFTCVVEPIDEADDPSFEAVDAVELLAFELLASFCVQTTFKIKKKF